MSTQTPPPPAPGAERSPFQNPKFIASAAFIAGVVLVGSVVVVLNLVDPKSKPADQPAAQAVADSVCGLPAGSADVPTTPPATSPQTAAHGVIVASLPGYGPGITDGVSRCYGHNPTGALLAATNWTAWSVVGGTDLAPAMKALLYPDEAAKSSIARASASGGERKQQIPVAGFKMAVQDKDNVIVTLAMNNSGQLASMPLAMRWHEGDWKVVAPANNELGIKTISGLSSEGFTAWTVN